MIKPKITNFKKFSNQWTPSIYPNLSSKPKISPRIKLPMIKTIV